MPDIPNDNNSQILAFVLFMVISFGWLLYQSGLLIIWLEDEEYGHGMMVIGLLAFVLYRNKSDLITLPIIKSWIGILLSLFALLMFFLGEISGIAPIQMYSIWIFIISVAFTIGGLNLFRKLIVPLCIIFLLIPLPNVLGPMLTSQLQLISSKIGVMIIRIFGGVVFLEGNVIDMGNVKLLVAEACSGLRYLFPLMSIGAIAGFLISAHNWIRWTIFLATIPVTVFMNSLRIGITGLLTEAYGSSHTEGFLHFFEGWVVFVASLLVLIFFGYFLIKITSGTSEYSNLFRIDKLYYENNKVGNDHIPFDIKVLKKPSVIILASSLFVAVIISTSIFKRHDNVITSEPFSKFPKIIGEWRSNQVQLPPSIIEVAAASDYYNGTFTSSADKKINLHISYYQDQKLGPAPHSPTLCIPGDGWKIIKNEPIVLNSNKGRTIIVSRLIIKKGQRKIVTYFWLKQGSRVFSQQFMARLNLIWFAIKENRADAALIRMVSEVSNTESVDDVDNRMKELAKELLDIIPFYVPD